MDDLMDVPDERGLTADPPLALAPADVPVAGLMDSKRVSASFAELVVSVSMFASPLSIDAFSPISMLLEVSCRPGVLLVALFTASLSAAIGGDRGQGDK
jgi:hypothetical protein